MSVSVGGVEGCILHKRRAGKSQAIDRMTLWCLSRFVSRLDQPQLLSEAGSFVAKAGFYGCQLCQPTQHHLLPNHHWREGLVTPRLHIFVDQLADGEQASKLCHHPQFKLSIRSNAGWDAFLPAIVEPLLTVGAFGVGDLAVDPSASTSTPHDASLFHSVFDRLERQQQVRQK